MQRSALVCLVSLLCCISALAQDTDPWRPSGKYDPAVPTVESVLGYKVGEQFTAYSDLARYYRTLATASKRVRLETYGKTYENRELLLLTISTPENLARLDAIRQELARLADPRKTTAEEADRLASEIPAVVWLGYNVHGDEANSAEAAMQVSYELAASQDPKVLEWLSNVVVLIDPLQNPDGHERFVQFYRSTAGSQPVADRFAAEQQQRWPRGRFNHYLFDLNRDWAWQTQVESRARVRKYLEWNPQVFVDLHEMGAGSTYFFPPAAEPIHELIRPWASKWNRIYGAGNAAAFNRQGFRYFTRDVYDAFAPAFGDTWPSLQGAIGMTYEQAGGGTGLAIELPDGQRRLTLGDRALRHFTASLATIETTSRHRVEKLKDFYAVRRAAVEAGRQGPVRHYYLLPGNDPHRVAELVRTLQRQGIEVQRATGEFKAEEASGYWGEKPSGKPFPAGTFVIDLAQPAGMLARALLEREAKLDINETYDLTGWSLPYSMGIETWAGRAQNVQLAPAQEPLVPAATVEGPERAAAYLVDWEQSAAVRLLARLSDEGFKSYVSVKPFTSGGRAFAPGTLVIPAETNSPALHARIRELAAKENCTVTAFGGGIMESGPDFGSALMRFVRKPRIAVLTGDPISPTQYGAIWHMFDQVLQMPFTPINAGSLRSADLTQYNVIIVPGDQEDGAAFDRVLERGQLRSWVSAGGVLIGIRGGAVWMTKAQSGLASTKYQLLNREADEARKRAEAQKKKGLPPGEGGEEEDEPKPSEAERAKLREQKLQRKLMTWEEREKYELAQQIPGAILRAKLDPTHPLGFGLREPFAVLNFSSPILELTSQGENPVYFPKANLKLSGYVSEESEKRLHHTAYAVRERLGRGHLILFADSPGFRGFWLGTGRLLTNAVFFGNISNPKLD